MTLFSPPGFRGVFRSDDDARAVYAEAAGIARGASGHAGDLKAAIALCAEVCGEAHKRDIIKFPILKLIEDKDTVEDRFERLNEIIIRDRNGVGRVGVPRPEIPGLDAGIAGAASRLAPAVLRTLDALHLASMDFLRRQGQVVSLASYDDRLVDAARALRITIYVN
jgi:hypothetical protein